MPNGEAGSRSTGSLLPAGLYATLGLKGGSAEHADALVALALEEHFVWAAIRLRREQAAQGFRISDDFGRTFVTNDRLDADLAPRNALILRIGVLLRMSNQLAEVATTLLETHIDVQVLSGEPFAAPGLLITGGSPESAQWMLQHWWANLDPGRFAQREGIGRDRRDLFESLGWSAIVATRPPLRYRVELLVAADVPRPTPESVPWTDVSLGGPTSAGTAPEAKE